VRAEEEWCSEGTAIPRVSAAIAGREPGAPRAKHFRAFLGMSFSGRNYAIESDGK